MRNIVILAILILAPFSLSAQTTLINNDDKDILLMSTVTGDIINIAANDSVEMLAPLNEVYYVYRRLSDSDSPQIVQKIGFCFLRVQGNRRFYERGSKIPIFIHNNSSQELLLEYGDMAITMPPGCRYCAQDLSIDPSMRALVYLSHNDSALPEARLSLIRFQFDGNSLIAEIGQ